MLNGEELMEAYEIVEKIEKLRKERGWTYYRLAEEACLSQTTLLNMRVRGTLPSVTTLAGICDAFGITLAEFAAATSSRINVQNSAHKRLTFADLCDIMQEKP